jgi:hypothetical protein
MIPTSTANMMIALAVVMFFIAVIDHKNRLYANIVISLLSAIIFGFVGAAISIGAVDYTSPALGDILRLFGFVAFVYTGFMIYEVIDIAFQEKTELAQQQPGAYPEEQQ